MWISTKENTMMTNRRRLFSVLAGILAMLVTVACSKQDHKERRIPDGSKQDHKESRQPDEKGRDKNLPKMVFLKVEREGKTYGLDNLPNDLTDSAVGEMEITSSKWVHEWWRAFPDPNRYTRFLGEVFVKNKKTGKIYTWNLIETSSDNNCNIPETKRHYYKKFENAQYGRFGFNKKDGEDGIIKGESRHVSAWIKFYADWGVLHSLWQTDSCLAT
jgi:hypothetical protein